MDTLPPFTIIVFTEHHPAGLERLLAALSRGEIESRAQVIVLDPDGRPDRRAAASAHGADYLVPDPPHRPAAWNQGVARAVAGRLAFTDDDAVPQTGWLAAFSVALDKGLVFAGGPDRVPAGAPLFLRSLDYVLTAPLGSGGVRAGGAGGRAYYPRHWNMAVDRQALLEVGGFDHTVTESWEQELAQRLRRRGLAVGFAPAAAVSHERETTPVAFVYRNIALARERARRPGTHFFYALPAVALVALGLSVLAGLIHPVLFRIPLVGAAGYGLLLAAAGVHAAVSRRDPPLAAVVPLFIAAHHVSHATGYLKGLLDRLRAARPLSV